MKLKELLKILRNSYRLRIIKEGKDLYVGFLANLFRSTSLTGLEEIDHFATVPEIRRIDYKDKGLMPPLEPEITPQYNFADTEIRIYYTIHLK